MATGIAIGLSRFEKALDLHGRDLDVLYPAVARPSATMVPDERHQPLHQHPHSHFLDGAADRDRPAAPRPQLPSISNFLEGVGRPDLAVRPPQLGGQPPPSFHERHNGILSPTTSPGASTTWSADRHAPLSARFDTIPPRTLKAGFPPTFSSREPHGHEYASPNPTPVTESYHQPQDEVGSTAPSGSRPAQFSETRPMGKTVVGEDVISGKGLCYIYDDGSYCQKVINGDAVNPKWGTTKAGKPRKRLGQACNTCREKKIKCDPSFPKCLQCQKFGRDCVFEAPSRNTHRIPKVPELDRSRNISEILEDRAAANELSGENSEATNASDTDRKMVEFKGVASPDQVASDARLELTETVNGSKRTKISPNPLDTGRRPASPANEHPASAYHKPPSDYGYALDRDPFEVNRELTEAILKAYFTSVNIATFCLVPQSLFTDWASRDHAKSAESRLVVYSMLAVGTLFYQSPEKDKLNQLFINITFDKVMRTGGDLTVQLVQARLLFTLHEFQLGQFVKAWELCGSAMRAACALELNTEEGIKAAALQCTGFFGLTDRQVVECVRRTFWLAFVMDRVGVACFNFVSSFSKDDLFLYLPCADEAYTSGEIPLTRFLDTETHDRDVISGDAESALGVVSHLIGVISLIADVQMLAHRDKRQVSKGGANKCQRWRQELEQQLQRWEARYSATLSAQSPRLPSDGSSAGGLHIMYHLATMQLHRYLPHKRRPAADVAQHITLAYHHAWKTLELAEQLVSRDNIHIKDYHTACNSPITGFAVMAAIDIVTAAGLNSDLLGNDGRLMMLTMNSVGFFDTLAEFWLSAKRQRDHVAARVRSLLHSARRASAEGKTGFFVSNPLGMSLGADNDVVYGTDRMYYFDVMKWSANVKDVSQLVEIPTEVVARGR